MSQRDHSIQTWFTVPHRLGSSCFLSWGVSYTPTSPLFFEVVERFLWQYVAGLAHRTPERKNPIEEWALRNIPGPGFHRYIADKYSVPGGLLQPTAWVVRHSANPLDSNHWSHLTWLNMDSGVNKSPWPNSWLGPTCGFLNDRVLKIIIRCVSHSNQSPSSNLDLKKKKSDTCLHFSISFSWIPWDPLKTSHKVQLKTCFRFLVKSQASLHPLETYDQQVLLALRHDF